jgi:hypothetical protein
VDGAGVLTVLLGVVIPATIALVFQLIRLSRERIAEDGNAPLRSRISGQILLAAFFNYATGVLLVIPGSWAGIERMVSLGSLFLLVGAAGFFGNFLFARKNGQIEETNPPKELCHS